MLLPPLYEAMVHAHYGSNNVVTTLERDKELPLCDRCFYLYPLCGKHNWLMHRLAFNQVWQL